MPGPCPARGSNTTKGRSFGSSSTALRRNDPHKEIVDRPLERAAVNDELDFEVEHVWGDLGQVLAILISALTHDVPEQHVTLRRIDHIFHGGSKQTEKLHGSTLLAVSAARCQPAFSFDGPRLTNALTRHGDLLCFHVVRRVFFFSLSQCTPQAGTLGRRRTKRFGTVVAGASILKFSILNMYQRASPPISSQEPSISDVFKLNMARKGNGYYTYFTGSILCSNCEDCTLKLFANCLKTTEHGCYQVKVFLTRNELLIARAKRQSPQQTLLELMLWLNADGSFQITSIAVRPSTRGTAPDY